MQCAYTTNNIDANALTNPPKLYQISFECEASNENSKWRSDQKKKIIIIIIVISRMRKMKITEEYYTRKYILDWSIGVTQSGSGKTGEEGERKNLIVKIIFIEIIHKITISLDEYWDLSAVVGARQKLLKDIIR